MSACYTMEGTNTVLEVYEDKVTITPKGVFKSMRSTKTIPLESITATQFKKAGALSYGWIEFDIPGRGLFDDNTTFVFDGKKNNVLAIEIKEYIELAASKLRIPQAPAPETNLTDELQKLAKLKEQGSLSDEEFQAAKKRLLE